MYSGHFVESGSSKVKLPKKNLTSNTHNTKSSPAKAEKKTPKKRY